MWTTDKDGLLLGLLSAEIRAVTQRDPGELYQALTKEHGAPVYERTDAPANREQKAKLGKLSARSGESIDSRGRADRKNPHARARRWQCHRRSQGDDENGWFAARPSGTEDVYKIYAESFVSTEHLRRMQTEAQALVTDVLK